MNEIIFTVKDSPEGGYEAESLGHSIFTEADDRPKIIRLHYVREEIIAA